MKESLLLTLVPYSYSRADLVYQMGLLKDFFEYIFFVEQVSEVKVDTIENFGKTKGKTNEDMAFLKKLPLSFFSNFSKDSFYSVLDSMSEEIESLKTLDITVPVDLGTNAIAKIGQWARRELDPSILLTVRNNPKIAVGCQFVWKNMLHDFSFTHYFSMKEKDLHEVLKLHSREVKK